MNDEERQAIINAMIEEGFDEQAGLNLIESIDQMRRGEFVTIDDPNADLPHDRVGGDCMTCGVKWPCPTVARKAGSK